MQKKILSTFLMLVTAFAAVSPALAKPKHEKAGLQAKATIPSDPSDEDDLFFAPKSDRFSLDDRMLNAVEIATLSARRHSHRHCWRAVKDALFEANVVSSRPTSKYAWQAAEELEQKFSFKKLEITDPFEAPVGSILVYGGPGAGHVEFRSNEGFVSDFANPRPSHRPLIGVYVSTASASHGIRE